MDFDEGADRIISSVNSHLRRMEDLEREATSHKTERSLNHRYSNGGNRAFADPIASKHLQTHVIRRAHTAQDPYDMKNRAQRMQYSEGYSSPTSNRDGSEKSQKKFEYLHKKIKYLDGKLLSLQAENAALASKGSIVSTEIPALPSEAHDNQIRELKKQVQYLMDREQKRAMEEKENKLRYIIFTIHCLPCLCNI